MSVQYTLSKIVTLGDLKKIGLTVEDHREDNGHPFTVSNENGSVVAISSIETNDSPNEDNWEITEFEGKFSRGGSGVMLEICDKLNRMFITDEDIDNMLRENKNEITAEMFKNRTEEFRKML